MDEPRQAHLKGPFKLSVSAALGVVLAVVLVLMVGLGGLAKWFHVDAPPEVSAPPTGMVRSLGSGEPLQPLPLPPELAQDKLRLGEKLFSEPRLSANNTLACANCHNLSRGGADSRRYSLGIANTPGAVNAPTIFNASLNFVQFWDGRAATLEAQAEVPLLDPLEMGASWPALLAKLQADTGYRQTFEAIYPDGVTAANVIDALVTFERSLLTQNAPFDRYLKGDHNSLTAQEIDGYRRFKDYGCASCHQGNNIGGNMFQRFGVMANYFANRPLTRADLGRFNVTGNEEDRYVFKVPSLRNVAVTAPYFHDGSAPTLEQAVTVMGRYQLGRELTPEDVRALSAFLRTLTGEWRGRTLQ